MGSFVDYLVGIPELIFIGVALLTQAVWLLCSCPFFMQYDLFGGSQMQWGPSDVLIPSPSAISFFSTPRSIFRILVVFARFCNPSESAATQKVSQSHCWGSFLCRVPQDGDLNLSPALFLVTNVTIFSRNFSARQTRWPRPLELILHLASDDCKISFPKRNCIVSVYPCHDAS